jgi:hypothetical protein
MPVISSTLPGLARAILAHAAILWGSVCRSALLHIMLANAGV